ncbi:hypothetical protein evm_011075 [Chilo suppressalis]|nr:hypothetical protein evm_011075 [Chilo suppressalis]
MLDAISEQLHVCQSALNQYIDEKRLIFPRLYFLSDDDLLELLGQARSGADGREAVMQTHLKKLFPGISSVKLGPEGLSLTALCSQGNDSLQLDHPVDIDCPVEVWLKNLESEMRTSLQSMTLKCVVTTSLQDQDPFTLPTQILCLVQNIRFTEQAEKAITSKDLHKLKANIEKETSYYGSTEIEDESERYKRQALILQCAHYLSVIRTLINNNVVSTSDWHWQKQLRFYFLNNKEVVAKMGLATISYSYEYLGVNTGQFVRTELADECFLILTQSLHLGLVGNPFGPAGTGKTESVKALGGLVGRLVLVFNCDEAMDAECMGRLLSGLALCGAWGCFDEFNRLSADTLAAVSHQLESLLPAMKPAASERMATLNEKQIKVSQWCGVAATMNPIGRGYGGRRELPAALERVLRPVAMAQPRGSQLVCRLLGARAISHADRLAADLCAVFTLARYVCMTALERVLRPVAMALERVLRPVAMAQPRGSQLVCRLLEARAISHADRLAADLCAVFTLARLLGRSGHKTRGPPVLRPVCRVHTRQICMTALERVLRPVAMAQPRGSQLVCRLLGRSGHKTRGPPVRRPVCRVHTRQICMTALERVLRPVAMAQPRGSQLVCRLRGARAISHADRLAADLCAVFTLASQLLSSQRHYDWGLRALKASVGSCGAALCANKNLDLQQQRQLVRRVLTLNNMSKLTQDDAERFENILSLVFADVPKEEQNIDPINDALAAAFITLGLVSNQSQIQKCMELYEQMQQRMGVVIVGPPGSGKTTIRHLLKNALINQGKSIVEYVICPKAMSRSSLLGHIDHDTRQWTDGVISATALEIANQPQDIWSWVVCDGDIDPEWIEALNSVLDDNRLLTLPSGWRIQFGDNVNFVFETHSLEYASPATVSRMGIILMGDESSCAEEVMEKWSRKLDFENESAKAAAPLLHQAMNTCLRWFHTNRSNVFYKVYDVSMVKQILTQFEYAVQNTSHSLSVTTPEEMVYLAIERSVLGILRENSVDSFREEFSGTLGPPPTAIISSGEWVSDSLFLSNRLATCEPALRACIAAGTNLLLLGPDASGKSLLIEHVLKESNCSVFNIDCTPMLVPLDIIEELKRNNVVRAGGSGGGGSGNGGSSGGEVALVVRGLHRTADDAWKCSPVHQFLLQLIQQGGFWSGGGEGVGEEGGAGWWSVPRLRVVATAVAAPYSPRLDAALPHLTLNEPDDEELLEITNNYLKESVSKNFSSKDLSHVATNMLSMFKEVVETFTSYAHYNWNADHLKRWCQNIKWYRPSNNTELITAVYTEANAIFKDRLVSDDEKEIYANIAKTHLKANASENICYAPKLKGDGVYMEPVEYTEWCQRAQKLINQCLSENENAFGDTGIEVCKELVVLYTSMARACGAGRARICVGSSGVGRRAAAMLAASALPAALYIVQQPHNFSATVKNALSSAGEGARTLLVICGLAVTSTELSAIEAVQSANSMHAIPAQMMPAQQSTQTLLNIKQNLGVVICLDKGHENLWELISNYPLLYNAEHVIWIGRWSADTLRQMPPLVIQRLVKESVTDTPKEELQTVPAEGFVQIYESLDTEYMRTPCRYIGFIKTYFHIVNRKKQSLTQRRNMLTAGVEALRRARSEVATLQADAAVQEAALNEKQESANRALEQISATVRANTDQREEMHALKTNIEAENEKLQIRKKEIEAELASVEPVIAAARAAVGDIRPESLSEIRSLRAPPDVVRDVLEGVLRLMGIADTSWHSMKNFLSKRGVKEDIRCLDASQITAEAAESVERLLKSRGSSFEAATARRASAACAPLAAWVRANLAYAGALHRVRPLQLQQARLHSNLREAKEQLAALSSGLASVEERVSSLQQQLGQHTRDAAALELKVGAARETIAAATALIRTLADEYTMWEHDVSSRNLKDRFKVNYTRLNRTLVITDVDGVHSSWAGLLDSRARLVLMARSMPRVPTACEARLSQLHCAARRDALTAQLVHYALQQLNPEVNEKSKEIKLKKATLQKQQHELQENLLSVLSTNSDILHDANLLASLNKTRETSATISEALEAAHAIERETHAASEAYQPSAERTALLALTVKSMATHRPLIALPIDVVLDIYVDALRNSNTKNINNDELTKYITRRVIERVLLSLHKKDKYKVILHILKQVYDDIIPDKLWQIFLGNYIANDDQRIFAEVKNTFKWITDEEVKKVAQIKVINEDFFNKLSLQNADVWKEFLESGDLKALAPLSLTHFELVLAVSILRPDSTYRAITGLVDYILGSGVMSVGATVGLAARWSGGRPALLLAAHALDVLAHHARSLTLVGVEEGRAAWERAVVAARSGGWVALVVGASPITQDLTNFIVDYVQRPTEDYNEEFRLWIVSEDRDIPPAVANVCVNVILEAPEGVKHNVASTLSAWGEFEADGAAVRSRVCLALFHAIVQERRAYIPQGWSRWYAWEWGEVSACASALNGGGGRELVLAMYSARAAPPDRRPLAALHRATLGAHALAHCWRPLGLALPLPPPTTTRAQAYLSAIDAFPDIDPPQLLGLPDNCRIAWERNTANDIIIGLKELDSTAVATNQDNKNNVTPLKMILALWKKQMSGSALIKADYQEVKSGEGWWAGVYACEVAEAARVCRLLHRALSSLARQPAPAPLSQTPAEWQSWWAGPEESLVYVREFCHRALAAEARMRSNTDHIPKEVDLRSFLYAARVVWALRARAAYSLGCDVNQLTLLTKWAPRQEECEEDGVIVRGLQLAGGEWAGGGVRGASPRAAPRCSAPALLLRYMTQNQTAPLNPEGTVEIPVYSSETREQELFVVRAPIAKPYDRDTAYMHALALIIAPLQ